MTVKEIVGTYNGAKREYQAKQEELKLKIARLEKRLKKLESKRPFAVQSVLVPLAKEIKERAGFKAYEIYGPFGIEGEVSVYFSNDGKDGNIQICEVETWCLTIKWQYKENDIENLMYWNGKSTNEYAEGTIGWLNGLNNVFVPLPNEIDEIIKVLRHSEKKN